MARYRVLFGFVKPNGASALIGDILISPDDLDEKTARRLCVRGRIVAEEAEPAPPPKPARSAATLAAREPAPDHRDPALPGGK